MKAGAEVAGIVAIGRRVNPEQGAIAAEFWSSHAAAEFDFATSHAWLDVVVDGVQ
jgi:hypothetical protein